MTEEVRMNRLAIWTRCLPALCLLAPLATAPSAAAAQLAPQGGGRLAIGNPLPGSLIAGRVSLSVAYDTGATRIASFTIFVNDQIHSSRAFSGVANRGIQYLEFDTRALPDGNHVLKIVAKGPRGILALDQVNVTIRNGVAGGADIVPPLVQFRGLTDGQTVSGKITLDVLAEDNSTTDLLVSIFVNQFPRLIKSRPPYLLDLNTSEFLDPATGTGSLKLEAWAYDKFNNLGKARTLTLNVVTPGPSENQTRAPGAISRPMPMDATLPAPEPLKAPGNETLVPLPGTRDMPMAVEPSLPRAADSGAGGRPVISRNAIQPGARPTQPRMARGDYGAVDPEFAPIGTAGRGALAGGKNALPYVPPRSTASTSQPTRAEGPELVRAPEPAARPAGLRSTTPGGGRLPAPKPTVMARATPIAPPPPALPVAKPIATPLPKPVAAPLPKPAVLPTPAPGAPLPKPEAPAATPRPAEVGIMPVIGPGEVAQMPDRGVVIPMPGAAPRPSADGPRASLPGTDRPAPAPAPKAAPAPKPAPVRMARAAKPDPIVVVLDPRAKPGQDGKVTAEVFRLNLPSAIQDRSHRVQKGDTLDAIARKHGVTTKSLLVANGLADGRGLRSGSVIRVPGTYDIVLNDRRVAFDVAPRIENGLALTPFRQILEHAGGVVVWNPEAREVRAATDQRDIKLRIGSKEAHVNQVVVLMDREAFLDSGRTIVPLTFMEKALDLKAEYDVKNGTVMLVRR